MNNTSNNSESRGLPRHHTPNNTESSGDGEPADQPTSQPSEKSHPPKPRPFDLTEPFQERGVWCFWLTADPHVQEYISSLNCILGPKFNPSYFRQPGARVLFTISPRYDHQETWLWIHDMLLVETREVELSDSLEDALRDAVESSQDAPYGDDWQ